MRLARRSFYYLLDGRDMIECIVAEVGNTPGNEQFLYVLHPKSSDITNYEIGRNNDIRFVFDKQVSERSEHQTKRARKPQLV